MGYKNRKNLRITLGFCAVFILAGGIAAFWLILCTSPATLPTFEAVRENYRRSDGALLDRRGEVIHELRIDLTGRRLEWAAVGNISPVCVAAMIASEDKRFFSHKGADLFALIHSCIRNLFFGELRGASTITMQAVALVDTRIKPHAKRRSWREKIQQILAARAMEKTWSKEEILEAYMNLVSFRGELKGIVAASRGLFGKAPDSLDAAESLILAALVRAPNASLSKLTERILRLNGIMKASLERGQLEAKIHETMVRPYHIVPHAVLAAHVAHSLLGPNLKKAQCTLDGPLQSLAITLLKEQISSLRGKNVNDGAILVAENSTGEILAYVGSAGSMSSAPWVDGVRAKRQAGSTLKPLLYALAFDKRVLTAASVIDDSPLEIATDRGIYKPENYDNTFRGPVPARIALASSLNIPAVRVLMLTGEDDFAGKLRELGFSEVRDGEHYGFSLALGSLDVSLYELVNAYRTLANKGIAGDLTLFPGQRRKRGHNVFSRETSFIVSHILADREARSATFGYENALATRFWSASKTGTSKDMRDNWCVGFSERYTVGVWVGNFSGAPMWNVSGISGAAPIWRDIMGYLHKATPSRPASAPQGVVSTRVTYSEPIRAGAKTPVAGMTAAGRVEGSVGRLSPETPYTEWFIKGTEPLCIESRPGFSARPRILYPPSNLIIALDPDIPETKQKVFFEAAAPGRKVRWILNDTTLSGEDLFGWTPAAGHYTLRLMDEDNRLLDEVSFSVRN